MSANCVPPTQVLYGVEQRPLTPAAWVALGADALSHPAAPLSPDDTSTVMPCAAACCHSDFQKLFPETPIAASQPPKLRLTTGARL